MCSNFLAFYCSLVILVTIMTPSTAAVEFQVGGALGWRRPDLNHSQIYDHWASNRKFHLGDSIRFEYKNDSVVEVEKWAYYHCDTSRPISVSDDGNTTVNLDRSGPFYFVSGDYEHCKDGQRLHVEVFPLHEEEDEDAPLAPSPYSNSQSIPFKFFSLLFLAFNAAFL